MVLKLKRDKYKQARTGDSKLYDIICAKCGYKVLVYQKDGPGNLLRLYFDRIIAPTELVDLQKQNIKEIGYLKCQQCQNLLASPYIYLKENRPAFRLFKEKFIKRLHK
jgi:DNA-directed RNA polymerase subunit RPC12/RpoP